MLRKIVRFSLVIFILLLLVLCGVGVAINSYLESSKEELLNDLADKTGFKADFSDLDFTLWSTFPVFTITIDSFQLRHNDQPASAPALLNAEKFAGAVSLRKLMMDTLMVQDISIVGGGLFIRHDSIRNGNSGPPEHEERSDEPPELHSLLNPVMDWGGLLVRLKDFDVSFHHPARHKKIELYLDSLQATADRGVGGQVHFDTKLDVDVKGIAFNTQKGSYLSHSSLRGEMALTMRDTSWELSPTDLIINEEPYRIGLSTGRKGHKHLDLEIEKEAINYDTVIALLPIELQKKMRSYHVSGPFDAAISVQAGPDNPKDPKISIDFVIPGHDVDVKEYSFGKVHTAGNFTNRLATREGGITGSKKNFLITLDSTEGYWRRIRVKTPRALIRGTRDDIRLDAPVQAFGPSDEINEVVKTENFIFKGGRFRLKTYVDASLNSVDEIITTSDGDLTFSRVEVLYKPAGILFPLKDLAVNKLGADIRFSLHTVVRKTGFEYGLEGTLDNLLPLLLNRPAENIRTDVTLTAPRVDWTDFLAIFGEDGMISGDEEAETSGQAGPASMKKALLGFQAGFRPHIEVEIDTVAYYDVFAVNDFKTGMRFDGDTLVLERTTFEWEESDISLSARLGLALPRQTPFRLGVNAENLNLNRLRPSLEYFGLQLPEGLDSLPSDLNIDFVHRGIIDDTFGIAPGYNVGKLVFAEGSQQQFSGSLAYQQGPDTSLTHLQLDGNPNFINYLFAAEDFFFDSGKFHIDLSAAGFPATLSELMENCLLRLEIDSSRITYRPAAVYLPIRKFVVDAENEQATFALQLFSEYTRSHVNVSGAMDRLTAFLYPELGRTFIMQADATAQSVRLSDFQYLMPPDIAEAAPEADTASLNFRQSLLAVEGIFSSFRPDISLQVDTFFANDGTEFTDIYASFKREDSTRLVLGKSGFSIAEGQVELSATYDYDRTKRFPFSVEWKTDSLALGALMQKAQNIKQLQGGLPNALRGNLSTEGQLNGLLNDRQNNVLMGQSVGGINLQLTDAEVRDWPVLQELGRKLKMKKRFERVKMTPLLVSMNFDSGEVWLPETEVQSTPLQLFVEGRYDTLGGADLLISVPLRNIGRGVLEEVPPLTGYALAGRKVYLVVENDKEGAPKVRFRLGRKRYFRDRGRLQELRLIKVAEREERKAGRQERRRERRSKE